MAGKGWVRLFYNAVSGRDSHGPGLLHHLRLPPAVVLEQPGWGGCRWLRAVDPRRIKEGAAHA
ncbi:MAG: hypothetical protein ACLU9S_15190 [Oscillospiraceae bacterium]